MSDNKIAVINVEKCIGFSECHFNNSSTRDFEKTHACLYVCMSRQIDPANMITLDPTIKNRVVRNGCTGCGDCVETCPVGAITMEDRKWVT